MKITSVIILLLTTFMVFPKLLYSQTFNIDSSNNSVEITGRSNGAEIILPAVNKKPAFPGGKKAWQDFLRSTIDIKVPFLNKAAPGVYQVMIRYVVGSNGKLFYPGADSNCGYGMEAEVLRCINKSADWIPAETASGRKVAFTLRTIVTFTVEPNNVLISFP